MEITEDLAQEEHERWRTNGLGGKVPVTVNSNNILEEAGFGRWNWILLGLCYTSCVLASSNHLSIIYLAYSPDFFFVTDGEIQNTLTMGAGRLLRRMAFRTHTSMTLLFSK